MSEVAFLSAREQARLVREGEVSPVELVKMYLERIERFDSQLNAYVTVAAEGALEAAYEAERAVGRGAELGPFHGVPIPIKDLQETEGIRTTYSCRIFADHVPDRDASTVRRLKEAGFIVLGKTNASEFGTIPQTESELNGICRNPWNPDHTPGGSSGGAAAAVAAGLAPVAQGGDGGGSIRIPASCCGLFGLKPARGRVSQAPFLGEEVAGFSTHGPIARTVGDAAAVLDVMAGYEPGDPYWAPPPPRAFAEEAGVEPGRLRVAFTAQGSNDAPVDPEVLTGLQEAAALLESLGHDVEEARPAWNEPELTVQFITVWQGIGAYHGDLDLERLEPINRVLAESARQTSMADYIRAQVGLHAFARRVVAFFEDYDLLLTPTIPMPPAPVGWIFEEDDAWAQFARCAFVVPFTVGANITGLPAASVPLHWTSSGLPVGMQLVAGPTAEATLIRVCAQLEGARPWAGRRPPIS